MTIMEWILVIEVVIFAVLGIMLTLMLFNRNKAGRRAQVRERTVRNTSCPVQDSCSLYRGAYLQGADGTGSHAPNQRYYPNNWNYYMNGTQRGPMPGNGNFPGAGYFNGPGSSAAYYPHGYEKTSIPSPVPGQGREQSMRINRLTPEDISAIEGRTLRHIDIEAMADNKNRTIPYGAPEILLRKGEPESVRDFPGTARASGKTDNRLRWKIDFIDMASGKEVSRDFRNSLVVGRQMPAPLESGRLYLSMDATVSRSQFCLFIENGRVMIENLSKVNITKKNGNPVWQPVCLEEGDILEMGRMRYRVKGISHAA